MEVILLESVNKLGNVGDVVSVKDGFGRNYLLPQKKAIRATNENKEYFEAQRAQIEKENSKKRSDAEDIKSKIEGKFFVVTRQAGEDGRLYGSVNSRDVAEAVSDVEIDKRKVVIGSPIKYLGVYPTSIALHPDVLATVNINVARSKDEAKVAQKDFLNPKKETEEEDLSKVFGANFKPEEETEEAKTDNSEKAESSEQEAKSEEKEA